MSAIPPTEPKETQTSGQAATHSSPTKKTKQEKTAEPTKKNRADKTTGTSGNTRQNKTVKSIKKTRADKTAKTSRNTLQKESVEQPREEADSPYQDTEKYPRLVQEFTAYYNKYQQLRQKVKDHPEILQGYQKDSRYSAYASSNPCMGQFRIILFTLLCKVNFTLNDIIIAWEISPTTSPKEKQCFSAETEALDLIDSLCRELASGNYPEMVMEYKPWDSYGDTPAFTQFVREYGNVDKEYPVAFILFIIAFVILCIFWSHGKLGLGAAYFLSLGFYILLPPIVHLFQADPTHPDTTGGNT